MIEQVAYECAEVARKLQVDKDLLVRLHSTGQLPGIKPGRGGKILIADRDLLTVLRRYFLDKAIRRVKPDEPCEAVSADIQNLSSAIRLYLERRYGERLLIEMAKEIAGKLFRRSDLRNKRSESRIEEERKKALANEILTMLLASDPRSTGRPAGIEILNLADAA
jgi:hypothetical protein